MSKKFYPRSFISAYSKVTYNLLLFFFISSFLLREYSFISTPSFLVPLRETGSLLCPWRSQGWGACSICKAPTEPPRQLGGAGSIWPRICQWSCALNLFSLRTFSFIFIHIYSNSFPFHENLDFVHKPRVRPMLLIK